MRVLMGRFSVASPPQFIRINPSKRLVVGRALGLRARARAG
jgi:hypothetical protein